MVFTLGPSKLLAHCLNRSTLFVLSVLFILLLAFPSDSLAGITNRIDATKVPLAEKKVNVQKMISEQQSAQSRATDLLTEARAANDIIQLNCVNSKLTQIKGLLKLSQQSSAAMYEGIERGAEDEINHQYKKIVLASQKTSSLKAEAEQCVGEKSVYSGETKVDVEIDPSTTRSDPTLPVLPPPGPSVPVVPATTSYTYQISIEAKDGKQEVNENAGTPLSFTVKINPAASKDFSLPYKITGVNADDVEGGLSGEVSVKSNDTTVTFNLKIKGDDKVEEDETLTITLDTVVDGVFAGQDRYTSATGIILNDDVVTAKKLMSIKPKDGKTEYKKGTDKEMVLVVTLACPADSPEECSASTCAADKASCEIYNANIKDNTSSTTNKSNASTSSNSSSVSNAQWSSGPWGACSSNCGGTSTRTVSCMGVVNGQYQLVDDSLCTIAKPRTTRTDACNTACPR